jgi:outer membrane lipoprotein carrier protein
MFGLSKLLQVIALMHGTVLAQPQAATPQPDTPAAAKPAAASPSSASVVQGVQKYYQSTDKFEAVFRQKYTNTVFGKTSISDGRVFIAKGGKMRWDYAKQDNKASQKFYISDGTTLWVYDKDNNQAFKQDLEQELLPVAITFLYGKGDLDKDFTSSLDNGKFGGKGDLVLKLVPKQPSGQYKTLWLVVDPSDFHVKQSVIEETSGNLNSFSFDKIKQNDKVTFSDKHFKFSPPKGTKIVDPSQAPRGSDGSGAK